MDSLFKKCLQRMPPPTLYNFMLHITLCSAMRLNLNLINVKKQPSHRNTSLHVEDLTWPELFQDSSYLRCQHLLPLKHLIKPQAELNLGKIVSRTVKRIKKRRTKKMKKTIKVQQLPQKPLFLLFRWPMRSQAGEGLLTQTLVTSLKC